MERPDGWGRDRLSLFYESNFTLAIRAEFEKKIAKTVWIWVLNKKLLAEYLKIAC